MTHHGVCLYYYHGLTYHDVCMCHCLCLEVRTVDAPHGGGYLEIQTASKTYSLRCADSAVLHAWRRELYELLPYLRATEVRCGWLWKRGEGSSAGFKRRYCVLFSSYRLLYFESEACIKLTLTLTLTLRPRP